MFMMPLSRTDVYSGCDAGGGATLKMRLWGVRPAFLEYSLQLRDSMFTVVSCMPAPAPGCGSASKFRVQQPANSPGKTA